MKYKGIKCPICEKLFSENDDIVVCPKCGAPYHRDCYNEKGECIFTELHENGEAWSAPEAPAAPDVTSEIKDKECPNCGVLNAHSALFCNICGSSLIGEPQQHRNAEHTHNHQNTAQSHDFHASYPPPMGGVIRGYGAMPFAADPMGGANPMDKLADDVTFGEASKVVQQNSGYYLSVFRIMKAFSGRKFNFTAFLFSGGWLLYRKQYKRGILVTALMFLLYIAQTLCSELGTLSVMMNALNSAGAVLGTELTPEQITIVSEYLMTRPGESLLFFSPLICSGLMLIVMFFVGFKANKWYMDHCIRTVRTIRSGAGSEEQINDRYRSYGGVNVAVVFCVFACYMVLRWVPMFF